MTRDTVGNVARAGRVTVLFAGLAAAIVSTLSVILEGLVGVDDSRYERARKERGA